MRCSNRPHTPRREEPEAESSPRYGISRVWRPPGSLVHLAVATSASVGLGWTEDRSWKAASQAQRFSHSQCPSCDFCDDWSSEELLSVWETLVLTNCCVFQVQGGGSAAQHPVPDRRTPGEPAAVIAGLLHQRRVVGWAPGCSRLGSRHLHKCASQDALGWSAVT